MKVRLNRTHTVLFLILALVTALSSLLTPPGATPAAAPAPTQTDPRPRTSATVARVIDGDTVQLADGSRVRLIGVDAPETVDPRRGVGCYGREASAFTKSALEGKDVLLEKDVSETDRYGRLLRYVWIGDIFFNEALVREGYAQIATYPPDVRYAERFLTAQLQARNEGKGLWSTACTPTPSS